MFFWIYLLEFCFTWLSDFSNIITPQVLSAVTDDSEIFKNNFTMYVYKYQKDHIEEELYMLFTYVRIYFFFFFK